MILLKESWGQERKLFVDIFISQADLKIIFNIFSVDYISLLENVIELHFKIAKFLSSLEQLFVAKCQS